MTTTYQTAVLMTFLLWDYPDDKYQSKILEPTSIGSTLHTFIGQVDSKLRLAPLKLAWRMVWGY